MTTNEELAARLARMELRQTRRSVEQKEQHRHNDDRLARIESRLNQLEKWKWLLVCVLASGAGFEPILSKLVA